MHRTGRKAQGLEARATENLVAIRVVSSLFQFLVMPVHFHDEASAEADEVRIIPQQRRLPPEVKAVCSQRPEPHPQANFLHAHHLP
jgi:hypothetical protein